MEGMSACPGAPLGYVGEGKVAPLVGIHEDLPLTGAVKDAGISDTDWEAICEKLRKGKGFAGIGGNGLGLPPLGGAVPADGGGGAYVFDSALAPAPCVVAAPTPTGGAFTRTYGLRRNSSRPLSATRSMELAGTKTGASSGGLRATIGSLDAE